MNLNLKLPDLKVILATLGKFQTAIIGVVLIALFGYTAYVVNGAVNVKTDDQPAAQAAPGITFDKATITSLNNLTQVPDQTAPLPLGTSNPFGQ